jgi:uncharacterized protein YbaR (Trm112 family)
MQALKVRRVSLSEDLSRPGDYVFIGKRAPIRKFEPIPSDPPKGFFRRIGWHLLGKKQLYKEIIEIVWPDYDTIILNCPECNGALAMPSKNKIISVEPLTLERTLVCPYCKTKTFDIEGGKIIPVVYHAT